ncbi:hypothetical protein [Peribacillus sp. Hz7]|uniref:hypothetical protein n=1 Tax=Peribacillus sp. Hz7 TaxID=3344873 RepID=UPI0035CC4EB2
MTKEERSLYDELPCHILAGFSYEIKQNIQKGILSNAMYHEIKLIEQAGIKNGVPMKCLYRKASCIVQIEKLKETSFRF